VKTTLKAGILILLAAVALRCNATGSKDKQADIRFPQSVGQTHPRVLALGQFADQIGSATGGAINVQVFPGGQLYSAREAVRAAAFGDVEMALEPANHFITFDDAFKAIDIPFFFKTNEDFHRFLDTLRSEITPSLQQAGLQLIALWDEGPMVLASRNRLLNHPDHFNGIKIRSSGHELLARSWNEIGAATVRIPIHEVYTALQQGVADAVYTTFHAFISGKLYEVAPKAVLWPARATYVWVVHREFWQVLPERDRQTILQAADEATRQYNDMIWGARDRLIDTVRALPEGEFYELSESENATFSARIDALLTGWKTEFANVLQDKN
jgi:TRAP-type C4-dicarboxylate transport system substrate-binding protein